jgi:hypothetical protein
MAILSACYRTDMVVLRPMLPDRYGVMGCVGSGKPCRTDHRGTIVGLMTRSDQSRLGA